MKLVSMLVLLSVFIIATACPAAEAPAKTDLVVAATNKDAGAPQASAAPENSDVKAGIALVSKGDFRKAVLILREVVKLTPNNAEANLYLGIALNRLSETEAESVLKTSLRQMPDNPYVNFELGLYYFSKNVDAEAGDYLESVIALSPGSAYAVQASQYLKMIEERGQEKKWELNILAGMQYDSNVIVVGDGPLPAGVTNEADFNAVINPKASYFLIKNEEMELTPSYSLYQTLHTNLTAFDVSMSVLDLSLVYGIAPKLKLKGSYSFEYLFLGGNRYNHTHVLAPGIVANFEQWGSTVVDYKYRTTSFTNSEEYPTNTDRNGDNHYVGITHTLPVGKSYSVWGGYSHDEDLTRTEFYNYHGDKAAVGFRATLPFDSMADISGEYYRKRYFAVDPSFPGLTRRDEQFMVTITLMKMLSQRFTLMAMEQYTRNFSNIGSFDTVRTLTSLFLNARF